MRRMAAVLELRTIPICCPFAVETLLDLPRRVPAQVEAVVALSERDSVAERLRELGFVAGEPVEVVAAGPLGGDPLLVQIGYTRFALRRAEAARVRLRPRTAATTGNGAA